MKNKFKCHLLQKDFHLYPTINPTSSLITIKTLDDDDHQIRKLLKCPECDQLYFYEFYEVLDYEKGNDAQYRTLIPVDTQKEAEELNKLPPFKLLAYFPRLQSDFGKEDDKTSDWKLVVS